MMTKKDKLNFLEQLKQNPRISDVWYRPDILKRGREDSIWYDDEVLSFTIDDRFSYSCRAVGDICIVNSDDGDYVKSRGCQADDVIEFLEGLGLTTDKKVSKAEFSGKIYFENNNWFEDWLYDLEKKQYIPMDGADISDGPFDVDLCYLDEWINDYLQEEDE